MAYGVFSAAVFRLFIPDVTLSRFSRCTQDNICSFLLVQDEYTTYVLDNLSGEVSLAAERVAVYKDGDSSIAELAPPYYLHCRL